MKRILFSLMFVSLISAVFAKADVSDKNARLIQAAKDGNLSAVQAALSDGAEINARDKSGVPALMWAANNGHTQVVKLLLERRADVNVKKIDTGVTALMMASHEGHTEVVKLLLDKGADVNVKDTDGVTALWMASQKGHTEVVKLLLAQGADVNVKATINNFEWTALKVAKRMGHTDIVRLLEKAGAKG